MEFATKAMERVKLGSSASSDDGLRPPPARLVQDALPRISGASRAAAANIGAASRAAATRTTKTVHWIWHRLGYTTFRVLSTLNLFGAVIVGVFAQIVAYYYNGLFNLQPLVAAVIYAPALAAMAVLRESATASGTSASGVGPARSRATLLSYLALLVSALLSIVHPLTERWAGAGISSTSMWIAIAGSTLFFYALLISEVLFAAAVNLKKAALTDVGVDDGGEVVGSAEYGSIA